jgi:hypothetical protein
MERAKEITKTAVGKMAKHSIKALRIGVAVLGLVLSIKRVYDRFIQFLTSKREYEARTARAEVNAFLYRAEKKNTECSLVNDIRMITDSQKETMFEIMELLEIHAVDTSLESSTSSSSSGVDNLVKRMCTDDIQMCYQILRGDLGNVLAESGIFDQTIARKIASLAKSGPITDVAISTNADEAAALNSMGFEPLSARPFEEANRLWACRMCSKYPIVNAEFTSIDRRDFKSALGKKKGRPLDLADFLVADLYDFNDLKSISQIEYLKLGSDVNRDARFDELYLVFARPSTIEAVSSEVNVMYDLNVNAVDSGTIGSDSA